MVISFSIFKKQPSFVFADGIVNHMASRAGPTSKQLDSVADAEKFMSKKDYVVVGMFPKSVSCWEDLNVETLLS